jgi:hypothetical protein
MFAAGDKSVAAISRCTAGGVEWIKALSQASRGADRDEGKGALVPIEHTSLSSA